MTAARSATIDDVARLAGVSAATVSRVMNGHSTVRPATIKRVMDAAERLDYVPSNAARSLSLGSTHTVAFLMPDLSNPMFQQVLRGATRAAAGVGYRLLVSDSVEDPDAEAALALELRRRSDALILCAPRMSPRDLHRVLGATEPVVLINRASEAGGVPVVSIDYAEGSRVLMRRLMRQGHRRFVYLAGPARSASNQQREQALRALVREHDDVVLSIIAAGAAIEDGYAALGPVLTSGATAVICYNDVVAIGLLGKLNEAGVTVPTDISVAGYDDIPFARYVTPPLTTVSTPKEDLGRHAWEAVERMLQGDKDLSTLTFAPRLVERGSTGPAPRDRIRMPASDAPTTTLAWHRDDDDVDVELSVGGGLVARYERRPVMPDVYSPRPYLHPVYTLSGRALTAANSGPHRHQHGISVALDSVNGTNYWGGRTYLPGAGPTLLPNHGTQTSRTLNTAGGDLEDHVLWRASDGTPQFEEIRRISAVVNAAGDGWELTWLSELTASLPVVVASPSASGREDARYGGLLWRFPEASGITIHTADGDGVPSAHGSRSPWVALVNHDPSGPWTVLLRQVGMQVPWHVRGDNYLAVCPSHVWDGPLHLEAGQVLTLGLSAAILDRSLSASALKALREPT